MNISQGFHRADFEAALDRGWAQAVTARTTVQEQVMPASSFGTSEEQSHKPKKKKKSHATASDQRPALESISMRVVGSGLLLEGDLDCTITVRLLALTGLADEEI
jgi:hypothetical protein